MNNDYFTLSRRWPQPKVRITPLDSYFIYCVHPERGSITVIIEQNEDLFWYSDQLPPFIDGALVAWIGKQIEEHNQAGL